MLTHQTLLSETSKLARRGSLYYLMSFLSSGSIGPFLYVYFTELGISGEQVGWLASLSPLMMLIALPVASLADQKHWRVRIIQIAPAGMIVTYLLLSRFTSFTSIILLMLLLATFTNPKMAISDSLIARMAQRHNLNYGGMRLWGSIGFATSALVFGAIWQVLGFKPMFFVTGVFLLTLIPLAGKLEEGPANHKAERKPVSVLFRDAGLVLLLAATFLAAISNSLSMTFGGIYARSLGGGNFLIGLMIACAGYSEILTMFYSDRIARRLQSPNTVILAYGLMAVAFLGYILLPNPNALPVFSVIKGLGYGLWFPTTVRMITARTPETWAATAQSLLTICMFGLAPIVAGPLGGMIHDVISPAAVFGLGVVALGLAALVLWLTSIRGKLA